MYCLMSKIKVNWVNVIREHIFKAGKKLEYRIPYVILLSNFIEYFEIDVEGEVVEEVKALNQISTTNLTKIGLKKMKNKKWICKADEESAAQDDDHEEESSDDDDDTEDDDEENNMNDEQVGTEGGTPIAPTQESYSRFKQLMINQLNNMENQNRSHHQYCETHFQFIETQVEDIQSKTGTLFFHQTNRASIAYLVVVCLLFDEVNGGEIGSVMLCCCGVLWSRSLG